MVIYSQVADKQISAMVKTQQIFSRCGFVPHCFIGMLMRCCRNLPLVCINYPMIKLVCYTLFHLKSQNLLMTLSEDLL